MRPAAPIRPRNSAVRLALFYGAIFLVAGIHLPYWPLWLAGQGLDAAAIGTLLSVGMWVKVVANPLVAQLADRRGERRPLMVVLALASLAAFALYGLAAGFWSLLAVTLLFGAAMAALMPLGENLAMLTANAERIDYGRVRLWGSLTFIVAAMGGGQLLVALPVASVYWLILVGLALTAAACALLPERRSPPAAPATAPLRRLLRAPRFVLFLIAASLIQASHSVYYGFGTLHWQGLGFSELTIGLLWAEGVVAEIVLFACGLAILRRVGITGLLALAAAAATLRWVGMAFAQSLWLFALLQLLHAFSFGAAHLAAMHFIAAAVPASVSATAQSLYSVCAMGAALALAMIAAGLAYAAAGGGAFLVMAAMTIAAAAAAALLMRLWRGETLEV